MKSAHLQHFSRSVNWLEQWTLVCSIASNLNSNGYTPSPSGFVEARNPDINEDRAFAVHGSFARFFKKPVCWVKERRSTEAPSGHVLRGHPWHPREWIGLPFEIRQGCTPDQSAPRALQYRHHWERGYQQLERTGCL